MQSIIKASIAFSALIFISACGETRSDRALSGAAIGAGVGAAGSAITGGHPVGGAAVGAGVGAAAGGLTDREDVDLGRPVWRR